MIVEELEIGLDVVNLLPSRVSWLHGLWVLHYVSVRIVDSVQILLSKCGQCRVEAAKYTVSLGGL